MTTVDVYDPPMCCSSGVCGTKVDKRLVRFSAALEWLRGQGIQVERYNPAQQYAAFAANEMVVKTINERGSECLPLILVNGNIVSSAGYPERGELAAWVGIEGGQESQA